MTKDSISNKLQELVDLKNSGAITNEEFDNLKKQLMIENEQEIQKTNLVDNSINRGKKKSTWFIVIGLVILILIFFIFKIFVFTGNSENIPNNTDSAISSQSGVESNKVNDKSKYYIKSGYIADIPVTSNIGAYIKKFPAFKKDIESGEGNDYTIYKFYVDDSFAFTASFNYDDEGNETEIVGDIRIYSPKFRTEKGIGVGSLLKDFIKLYPDYAIVGNYEYGTSVSSKEAENISFEIDGYIGTEKMYDGDLKLKDFNPNSKILSIRMYAPVDR